MSKDSRIDIAGQLPEKVLSIFEAVSDLLEQDIDLSSLTVAVITEKAGIGKGTAYDYFDSKEEIIASAMIYQMHNVLEEVWSGLQSKGNFAESIEYLLQCIDDNVKGKSCIVRFATLLMDKSEIGKKLRSLLERQECNNCHPELFLKNIIARGVETGELRKELPVPYMVRMVISKLISYAVFLLDGKNTEEEKEQFKKYLYQGIIDEFLIK